MKSSIKIGLTGGPGCGKSAVAGIFATFSGWTVLDADKVCHEIYTESHSSWCKLLEERWGKEAISKEGLPDRKFIAEKIFNSEGDRLWLNGVLHPEIRRRLEEKILHISERMVMIEVPLLFESSWESTMDSTVAVWSAPEIQMTRLLARKWTKEHALSRIRSQFPAEKKLSLADYGVINNGSLEELEDQCRELEKILSEKYNNKK